MPDAVLQSFSADDRLLYGFRRSFSPRLEESYLLLLLFVFKLAMLNRASVRSTKCSDYWTHTFAEQQCLAVWLVFEVSKSAGLWTAISKPLVLKTLIGEDISSFFECDRKGLAIKAVASLMPRLKVSLLTGRTIRQGQGKEYGKLSRRYWKSVTVCEFDPEDMKCLGIKENQSVRITTDFGSVVIRAAKSKRAPHRNVVFVPYGPWASVIVNPETHGTGMPSFKGIEAVVEPASDGQVLKLRELLRQHYRKE